MNVLVIGGTRFVGLHIVHALQAAGANVTVFHRGKTQSAQLTGVEEVYGDRATDLHRLGKRTWDAVIDTSAYTPNVVDISTRYFGGKTQRYVFISTISVYDHERLPASIDEDAPLYRFAAGDDPTQYSPEKYGALKVLCEHRVFSTFRDRALVLRPCVVAGPFDNTDRFTYWPLRVARGGEVLVPDSPAYPAQYIDAADLARFTAHAIQRSLSGTYNIATTPGCVTFGSLFEACVRAARVVATPKFKSAEALIAAGVAPWTELPLFMPPEYLPAVHVSNARARIAGLQLRPVYETALDVLQWARASGKRVETLLAGLKPERERELLGQTAVSMNASALR